MSHLAVGIKPPGGFWEKPRNPIKQCGKIGGKHTVSIIKAQYNAIVSKTPKTTPLTWIPCPNSNRCAYPFTKPP